MMPEDDINKEIKWWNNTVFVTALEKEYEECDSSKEKGYSMAEINADIAKRKEKRQVK